MAFLIDCESTGMAYLSEKGFTLAELLIALLILAEIATFSIPKILVSTQNGQSRTKAKEAIGMMAEVYQKHGFSGQLSSGTSIRDLTPYMNYVKIATTGTIDDIEGSGSGTCSSSAPCIHLHSGAAIRSFVNESFGGTATTNAIWFHLDPDGKYGGSTTGPSKSVPVFLYYNGRIVTEAELLPGTRTVSSPYSAAPGNIPDWFSWN